MIGANDVANSFATSVGAKVLTLRQAVVIAAFFEFAGALLMGSNVTDTLRKGIVSSDLFIDNIYVLMFGMLCACISTGLWLAIATYFKAPVSTTHSVVGSIVGFALAFGGLDTVKWEKIGLIVLSWVVSPLLSGILTYGIFAVIKYGALKREEPLEKSLLLFPIMVFLTMGINTFFIIYKGTPALGLKNTPIEVGLGSAVGVGVVCAIITWLVIKFYLRQKIIDWGEKRKAAQVELGDDHQIELGGDGENSFDSFTAEDDPPIINFEFEQYDPRSEKLFSYLQIFTACLSAFAHGANDVANSIGPYAAIVGIYFNMTVESKSDVPIWVLAIGGGGIAIGLALWGRRVIERMGKELVKITATRGFSMELGASLSVVTASRLGIPVSTTHCQVGSIVGGGLADGKENVSWGTFLKVIFGWVITLPITAAVSAALFSFGHYAPS